MKLTLELVPSMASGHSLSRYLRPKVWNAIRSKMLAKYDNACGICGARNLPLNCHEQWEYDDETYTQKLVKLVILCSMCHLVKHMNTHGASLNELAVHFMRINRCSQQEFNTYYHHCREGQKRRETDSEGHLAPIFWEQDWGEYTLFLAQEGNLRQGYRWDNGCVVYYPGLKKRRKK